MKPHRQFIIITVSLMIASSVSQALASSDDWSLTTADFQTHSTVVRSLSDEGVRISTSSGDDRLIPLNQFVSLQRTSQPSAALTPTFMLLLSSGDRLSGQPAGVVNEQLNWQNFLLGKSPIPLTKISAILRGSDIPAGIHQPTQDIISLSNGDTVTGVITDCLADQVTIQTAAGPTPVPMASVAKILFASTAPPTIQNQGYKVKLIDNSILTISNISITADQATLTLDAKRTQKISLQNLVSIEQLNGPISWLSSRTPSKITQTNFFGGTPTWPPRFNSSVDGTPIQLANKTFDHGIGVHSYSRLDFPIEPGWNSFRTQYAIDSTTDSPRPLADVTVRILLDNKIVHEQQHVRAGATYPLVQLDLSNAKTLALEVDYGDAADTQDHLNWIEPALLRAPLPSHDSTTAPAGN